MNGNIKVLDCTLRDGGLGLEDFSKNDIITETFTRSNRIEIADEISFPIYTKKRKRRSAVCMYVQRTGY